MFVCICNGVTDQHIRKAIDNGCRDIDTLARQTGCGNCCGKCLRQAEAILSEPETHHEELPSPVAA